jgi:uncharacterized protein (TIGR02594 family)
MADAPWMMIAEAELGITEFPGAKHNNRILEYHATTGLSADDDETPWCSSFVNWNFQQLGMRGTGSASARSWLRWGSDVRDAPLRGAVVILWRGSPNSASGHVGFLDHFDDMGRVWLLGGNQNNRVSIADFPRAKVIGMRWPDDQPMIQGDNALPILRRGSRGAAVAELQQRLRQRYVPFLVDDGIFGRSTEAAVRAFQESRSLAPDGVCGARTWAALS